MCFISETNEALDLYKYAQEADIPESVEEPMSFGDSKVKCKIYLLHNSLVHVAASKNGYMTHLGIDLLNVNSSYLILVDTITDVYNVEQIKYVMSRNTREYGITYGFVTDCNLDQPESQWTMIRW